MLTSKNIMVNSKFMSGIASMISDDISDDMIDIDTCMDSDIEETPKTPPPLPPRDNASPCTPVEVEVEVEVNPKDGGKGSPDKVSTKASSPSSSYSWIEEMGKSFPKMDMTDIPSPREVKMIEGSRTLNNCIGTARAVHRAGKGVRNGLGKARDSVRRNENKWRMVLRILKFLG